MNFTNFTTEKAACQQLISKWEGRDTAYVVFSSVQIVLFIVQIVITCGGLYWANRIIKNKEWKDARERLEREERDKKEREDRDKLERLEREDRDKLERLEREERDKIAQIVSGEYYEIENIHEKLRKCKKKSEAVIIFCGRFCTITGLDVLKYMCHPDNYPHYVKNSKLLEGLHSDLDAVVRLFQSFRIKLPPHSTCPENIREELGPLVIELGDIAGSFVSGKKYYTISKVLKYFEDTRQCRSLEEQHKLDFKNNGNVSTNVPYINDLCFGDSSLSLQLLESLYSGGLETADYCDTDFTLEYEGILPNQNHREILSKLEGLHYYLCNKMDEVDNEMLESFVARITNIWSCLPSSPKPPMADYSQQDKLRVNVLHAIRVFRYEAAYGSAIMENEQFMQLVNEMYTLTMVQDWQIRKIKCERAIRYIQSLLIHIQQNLTQTCEQKNNVPELLEQVQNSLSSL